MEIIRHNSTTPYTGIPGETIEAKGMDLKALGLLTVLLWWSGQDSPTLATLGSRYGDGVKARMKTLKVLHEGRYVAHFRVQHAATGGWGTKLVVSEYSMTTDEINTIMDELVSRSDIIGLQLMDHTRKSVPGMSRRKSSSVAISA